MSEEPYSVEADGDWAHVVGPGGSAIGGSNRIYSTAPPGDIDDVKEACNIAYAEGRKSVLSSQPADGLLDKKKLVKFLEARMAFPEISNDGYQTWVELHHRIRHGDFDALSNTGASFPDHPTIEGARLLLEKVKEANTPDAQSPQASEGTKADDQVAD